MRIVVSKLPDDGQDVPVEGPWAVDAARRALDAEPVAVGGKLHVEKGDDALVGVSGEVSATARRTCERCGEDTDVVVTAEIDVVYGPMPARAEVEEAAATEDEDEEGDLDEDEEDGWYTDDALELGDVVCEAITLEVGPRIACADVEACDRRTAELLAQKGASGNPAHPAFAKLKGLG